jgi:hypothetical protein
MEFAGIVQVCHVVHDLDAAMSQWTNLYGAGPFYAAEFRVEGQHYRSRPSTTHVRVGVSFCGPVNIELLQPLGNGPSIFHEVLSERGEGLHHFWRHSDDFDADLARYASHGCPVVAGGLWPGVGRTAFVDTRQAIGAYTEVLAVGDSVYALLERIRSIHRGWDGADPVRPYSALLAA